MKKILFPLFVAILAISFSACKKDKTDDELKVELQNSNFKGSNDNGNYVLNLAINTFELDEPDTKEGEIVWPNISTGTWTITDGNLVLAFQTVDGSPFSSLATVTVSSSSKLLLPTWDGASYSGPTVELKKQ